MKNLLFLIWCMFSVIIAIVIIALKIDINIGVIQFLFWMMVIIGFMLYED